MYRQEIISPDADVNKLVLEFRRHPDFVLFVDFKESRRSTPPGKLYQPFLLIIPEGERPDVEEDKFVKEHKNFIPHETLKLLNIDFDLPPELEIPITKRTRTLGNYYPVIERSSVDATVETIQ